ncbi:scopoletin glucosyltransferase-like [Mercurialis annua]|uniref:scopoletin glucosyltransferase-like n=1 Tax=Mercurialis annua TaxID=3986 RepID=UPI00216045B8|nr:scopoletin glucosyltransferase-like [Mercurialis annua]
MCSSSSDNDQLHIFFFPFMAHGHTIPTLEMANLFSSHGVKSTIITTPLNAQTISKKIQKSKDLGFDIGIRTLKFPAVEGGLPEGCENMDVIISNENQNGKDSIMKFFLAISMLQEPFENLIRELKPDCLVSDAFFPWTSDVADKFSIPRLVFHGIGFFSLCTSECISLYEPHKKVSSDSEPFLVPSLPGEIKFTRKQLPDSVKQAEENDFIRLLKSVQVSHYKKLDFWKRELSYGVVVNSFYELEPLYADFYRNELGRKAWHIGPLNSYGNRKIEERNDESIIKWLDSKKQNSVVYICFGSLAKFTNAQLKELAAGLENSGHQFIWVVRRDNSDGNTKDSDEEWLPEGYEARTKEKGKIIRGWAPQVVILAHQAIGGFVTHCGWNSTLEAITSGKPMVTWPIAAEQFYNEKLVTEVLKIGIGVGAKEWVRLRGDYVESGGIERAVKEVMIGEDAAEMRTRAEKLAEMARVAVEEGGSSYSDFNALVQELRSRRL